MFQVLDGIYINGEVEMILMSRRDLGFFGFLIYLEFLYRLGWFVSMDMYVCMCRFNFFFEFILYIYKQEVYSLDSCFEYVIFFVLFDRVYIWCFDI